MCTTWVAGPPALFFVPGPPDFDHGLHVSKFTVPSCSCFVILSILQIPMTCHAKWSHLLHWMHSCKPSACSSKRSQNAGICFALLKTELAERPSLESEGNLPEFVSKESCLTDWITIPRMPWDAVSTFVAHHADQFWDKEVRRPPFQIITRGSSPSPDTHCHFGHGPSSTTFRLCIRAADSLPDGSRSGPFQDRSRIAKQKRTGERDTCECVVWCWKHPSGNIRFTRGSRCMCSAAGFSVPAMKLSSPEMLMNPQAAEIAVVLHDLEAELILSKHIQGLLHCEPSALG